RPGSAPASVSLPAGPEPRPGGADPQVPVQAARGSIPDGQRVRRSDLAGGGPDVPRLAAQPRAWSRPVADGSQAHAERPAFDPDRYGDRPTGHGGDAPPCRLQPGAARQAHGDEIAEL